MGVLQRCRDPARAIVRGKYSLNLGVLGAQEFVPLRSTVLDVQICEEVAVDKKRERAISLVTGFEPDCRQVLITFLGPLRLGSDVQRVGGIGKLGGGAGLSCVEALARALSLFCLGGLAAYLHYGDGRLRGDELSVLAARGGAVRQLITAWLRKCRVVVGVTSCGERKGLRGVLRSAEHMA